MNLIDVIARLFRKHNPGGAALSDDAIANDRGDMWPGFDPLGEERAEVVDFPADVSHEPIEKPDGELSYAETVEEINRERIEEAEEPAGFEEQPICKPNIRLFLVDEPPEDLERPEKPGG